jgi:hypothetical protein
MGEEAVVREKTLIRGPFSSEIGGIKITASSCSSLPRSN